MGPTPTYHLPKGEVCETTVGHGLLLAAAESFSHMGEPLCGDM